MFLISKEGEIKNIYKIISLTELLDKYYLYIYIQS